MQLRLTLAGLLAGGLGIAADLAPSGPVTFNKQVLPILQKNCQGCHRPGQMAPMSFLTFENVRPWAKAMKAAVVTRKMPPWSADPHYGPYLNDRSLKQDEIDTIAKWADSGAPAGDPKDAPPAAEWPQGWVIQPDLIIDGPVTEVPATAKNNVVEWITVVMPTGFTRDTWLTSVEIRPEHPAVAHHICIGYAPHRPNVKYGHGVWATLARDEEGAAIPEKGPTFVGRGQGRFNKDPDAAAIFDESGSPGGAAQDCYLPGNVAADYRPLHAAKLIPAGYDVGRTRPGRSSTRTAESRSFWTCRITTSTGSSGTTCRSPCPKGPSCTWTHTTTIPSIISSIPIRIGPSITAR